MANIFTSITAPVGNGVGPAADVTDMTPGKMVILTGTWDGVVSLEFSQEGTCWAPMIESCTRPCFRNVVTSCAFIRMRVSGNTFGTPAALVGSPEGVICVAVLPVPAGNGEGAPVSVATCGIPKVALVGTDSGQLDAHVTIEGSNDGGASFVPVLGFNVVGQKDIPLGTFEVMRAVVGGVTDPIAGLCVAIGAPSTFGECFPPTEGNSESDVSIGGI